MMATMVMMAMTAMTAMMATMVMTAMTMKARSSSAISLQLSTTVKKAALNVKRPIMKTTPKITGTSSLNSDTDTNVATKKTKASVVSMTSTACGPIQTLIPKRADLKTPPADPSTHTLLRTISSSPEKHQETRKW